MKKEVDIRVPYENARLSYLDAVHYERICAS